MKQLLQKLKESIEIEPGLIQFKIKDNYYELNKDSKNNWSLFTVFGKDLKLDTKKLKGLSKKQVTDILKNRFSNIDIY